MNKKQEIEQKRQKEYRLAMDYLTTIHYFDFVQLNSNGNEFLKDQCKKDIEALSIVSGEKPTYPSRPYHSQDEIVIGRIHEASIDDFNKLFIQKFNDAQLNKGFKTKAAFAKHEYNYKRKLWEESRITKWFPIADQWLNFLKNQTHSDWIGEMEGSLNNYLNETGKKILPELIEKYGSSKLKKEQYSHLLWAMIEENLFELLSTQNYKPRNIGKFIEMSRQAFGEIGDRTLVFNNHFRNIKSDLKSDKNTESFITRRERIDPYSSFIKELLTSIEGRL